MQISFVLAALSLLTIPGPTNALLATSSAGVGISRSIHLLAAELAGYLTAVVVLRLGLAPLGTSMPLASIVLRAAVILYLVYFARVLWRCRCHETEDVPPVTFRAVLLTTLLNPKAAVLAFAILPPQIGLIELAATAVQVVAAGAAWLAFGAVFGHGLRDFGRPGLVYRLSAVVLLLMATAISVQSLRMV
jgi:threonine/homoserine/homoserine lactone efflux protein